MVVILHGYGADGADLIDLGRSWSKALPEAVFVAPDAPEPLPGGIMAGRQWFPLTERDPHEYKSGARAAAPSLERFIQAELQHYGIGQSALALVGFSQGAMMALQVGLRLPVQPAAIVAYSGLLPGPDSMGDVSGAPSVLIVHGADDDVVEPFHLTAAETVLAGKGISVSSHLLPQLGHSIDERGMVLGGRFLSTHLPSAATGGQG